ncbi:MAG: putative Phage tail length tape measure protein, partial [Ramlibacter sp.]|nr:putative Phage tail length tape measure protein [Ramlibacter sp.]
LAELKKEAEAMGVAVGAAFAAVGAASVAMVKSAIDAADAAGETAQKVGLAVEQYTALVYAAKLGAVSQETLGASLVKLSRNMSDAAEGTGDAVKGFDALGISVTNADGSLKTSDQVLTEVAGKFAGFKDGAEKTALAVNIFGKAGADLIPMLNMGAEGIEALKKEAADLGIVLSGETAAAAGEFNDNLDRMAAAIGGVSNRAASELLPALREVSGMLVDVAKNEGTVSVATDIVKGAVGGLITVFQTIAVVGSDVGFVFLSVGREIGAWAAQIAALGRGDLRGFTAISDAVKADGERARAELDKFQARVMAIGQAGGSRDPRLLGDVGSIASQTAGWGKVAAPRLGGPGGRLPSFRAGRAPAGPREPKPFATSDRFDEADALAMESEILNEAQRYAAQFANRLQEVEKPLRDVAMGMSEVQRMTEGFGQSFSNAIEDMVLGGGSAKEVIGSILRDIAALILKVGVLEPMMARLRQSMSDGVTPPNPFAAGGGGGIDWGGMLSNVIGSAFGGFRAEGGPVAAGVPYMVGERGPELFTPRTAGAIVPNHALGSGKDNITIVNQTTGRIDRVQEQRIAPGERALIIQEAVEAAWAQPNDPNSRASRTLSRNFNVRRNR